MPLLDVKKLTMRFGGLTAVSQVDLGIDAGQICSVIGPNGAGKTTVFNAITGIYEPTEGTVTFQGRELRRPFTPLVVVVCVLIGLATGLAAALFMGNIDKLWRAAIKRNINDPSQPFSYANVVREGAGYLRGELGVEAMVDGQYIIVSADGSRELGKAPDRESAAVARQDFEHWIAIEQKTPGAFEQQLVERDGAVVFLSHDGQRELTRFGTREIAIDRLAVLQQFPGERVQFWTTLVTSFILGTLVGSAGAFVIWQRSRRTPDVISLGGLARTFQNIRLFHNMTVLENVLVGMDRKFSRNVFASLLRLPGARAEEQERIRAAREFLSFVGLKQDANDLAKNLPYGDQRRLEIARALATEPKLLLLDEPAAGMNPSESDNLMHLVRKIRDRGITVVLIEHHMRLVMNISDRIAVLDHGEKIAEGTPAEVRANPKVVEAYLGKEEVH